MLVYSTHSVKTPDGMENVSPARVIVDELPIDPLSADDSAKIPVEYTTVISIKSMTPVASDTLTTFDAVTVLVKTPLRKLIVRLLTSTALVCVVAVPVRVSVATVGEVFVRVAVRPAGTPVMV